ncbi:MAG: type II secretion system F family protein [Xanthomonadales bacterium]|nr:type II secretion system F family protein [Xanthomonadales bacterium]
MASFRYKAVAPSGEVLQGQMDAESIDDVIARLQDQGNLPLEAVAAEGAGGVGLGSLFRPTGVSQLEVGQFTQQLATLLGAGLPLDRSLQVQMELGEKERFRRMVQRIRDEVRGGTSLSEALDRQHGVFSRLYINMVRAGELGGTLDQTLARLAEYMERSKELKSSIVSAMIYPIILLVLAGFALVFLLLFVIPRFTPIFEELGGELPLLTQIVLGMANAVRYGWWVMLLGAVGAAYYMRNQFAHPVSRLRWDERLLKLKGIGDLIAKVDTARLARTTGTLLKNGVPLLASLSIARNVLTNTVLSKGVDEASKEVKTGGSLAHALSDEKQFPRLALQMISVGEETGQLDNMLLKVADTYDKEVRTAIDRLMAAFVPVVTIILAGFISMIVLSMVMAIMSMNELFG